MRTEAAARHLADAVPAILYVEADDEAGTNLFTGPQVERILGHDPASWRLGSDRWTTLLHEDDRERVATERRRSRAEERPFRADYRVRAAGGAFVWIRDRAVPLPDEGGRTLCWRGVMLDITAERAVAERLRESEALLRRTMEERRSLLARLEDSQEEERRRIAADLHDDSIQVISAADLQLQALSAAATDPQLRDGLAELHETLQLAVGRLRHLLFELRPTALDQEGLEATLRAYHEDLRFPVGWTLDARLEAEPPLDLGAILFRIAQEAVTNAGKHADAQRLEVSVTTLDGGIRLLVRDDGMGFDPDDAAHLAHGHIGLPTMKERAELAGGWCRLDSRPGLGTTVEAWVPIPPAARAPGPVTG